MPTELTKMMRLHPQTAKRLRFFALAHDVPSMSAAVELLLNLAGEPPVEATTWAGEPQNRPRFEALLSQAKEAGDKRLEEFAQKRLDAIDAAEEPGE